MSVKYGIIGTGNITREFIEAATMVDGLVLSAVYSRTYEKGSSFTKAYGDIPVYTDLNEFASSDIDAVYIASPNCCHYEQSRLMLEHGKHVICEKPITVTPDELREVQTLAADKGLIYMEAIMYLYTAARSMLASALMRIGRITTAHLDFSQLSSRYPALLNGELPNIFNPAMKAGCFRDLGVYCVYPAVDFFGEPQSISASAGILDTGADGFGSAILNYADKMVTLTYSKIGQGRSSSQIIGDEGTIIIESISQLQSITIIYNNGHEEHTDFNLSKPEVMRGEASAFLNFINRPEATALQYNYSKELALSVSKTMDRIIKSGDVER